jgi:hypothetical protein
MNCLVLSFNLDTGHQSLTGSYFMALINLMDYSSKHCNYFAVAIVNIIITFATGNQYLIITVITITVINVCLGLIFFHPELYILHPFIITVLDWVNNSNS